MICLLCLNTVQKYFCIFDTRGISLNAAQIIGEHFWFEPKENNSLSKNICESCWDFVSNFHSFYTFVQNAHKNLTSVTTEEVSEEKPLIQDKPFINPDTNKILNSVTETKRETDNSEVEIKYELEEDSEDDDLEEELVSEDGHVEESKNSKRNKAGKFKKLKTKTKNEREILKKNLHLSDEEISKVRTFNCNSCSLQILTFTELKRHMRKEHNENGYAVCCNKKFFKRFKFVNHLQMHLKPEEFKCPHCDKKLGTKKYVEVHIKNIHTEIGQMKKFNCDQCEKTFSQKAYLERHKLSHVPESEKQFACETCGNKFPTQSLLRIHILNVHENKNRSICDLCGKTYKSPADLKRHRLEHLGIHEPKIQCEICGDWLSNKYKLKRHMLKHTTAGVEHRCDVCNKVSSNLLALKSHMRLHIAERKFQCNICKKGFRRSLNLKEHMTTHTGESLYSCPNCPRTFTHHSNLHHHRKKIHPIEVEEDRKLRYLKLENYNKSLLEQNSKTVKVESN